MDKKAERDLINLKRLTKMKKIWFSNLYRGKCPFCKESLGSFVYAPKKHICHCFDCGVGGNPTDIIMDLW